MHDRRHRENLMTQPRFDDLTDAYEAMIDWDKRLAREGAVLSPPF